MFILTGNQMRVALFTDTYLPTHDGVGHMVDGLAHTLARRGHKVTIFTVSIPGVPSEGTKSGVRVVRSRSIPLPYYDQYRSAVMPWFKVTRAVENGGFDIAHIHTPAMMGFAGLLASRHWDVPALGTFHTNVKEMQKSLPRSWSVRAFFRLFWFWNAGVYARCSRVTAPTDSARALLLSSFRKKKMSPIEVVHNGIDTEIFHPGITTPDWPSRLECGDRPIVTYLGRLTLDKGIHTFLDSVALLPEGGFRVVVAGEGIEKEKVLARLASEPVLGKMVRYVGSVTDAEKAALLSQSKLWVMPSTADTSSISALEALSSGAVCIAGNVGGPTEIISDGETGFLVDPHDAAGLARTISNALANPQRLTAMSRKARAIVVDHFSIESMTTRFLELYEGEIRSHAGPNRPMTS
jgi:glycosyltransferase involved in cell wall biosynthesis